MTIRWKDDEGEAVLTVLRPSSSTVQEAAVADVTAALAALPEKDRVLVLFPLWRDLFELWDRAVVSDAKATAALADVARLTKERDEARALRRAAEILADCSRRELLEARERAEATVELLEAACRERDEAPRP